MFSKHRWKALIRRGEEKMLFYLTGGKKYK